MVIVPKKIPRRNRRKKSPAQIRKLLRKRQRRILDRIANRSGPERDRPMITATNIHYEWASAFRALPLAASAPCCCWLRGRA